MNSPVTHANKTTIATSFGTKVSEYAKNAGIQRYLAQRAHAYMHHIPKTCPRIVDLGSGGGEFLADTKNQFPHTHFISVDIAFKSLCHATHSGLTSGVCTDFDSLCFKNKSLPALVATSSLQWSTDLQKLLATIATTLSVNGVFVFGIFLEGTLFELDGLRAKEGIFSPVLFPTRESFERLLNKNNLTIIESSEENQIVYHKTARHLIHEMNQIGATAHALNKQKNIDMLALCANYARNYSTVHGVAATYKLYSGIAINKQ